MIKNSAQHQTGKRILFSAVLLLLLLLLVEGVAIGALFYLKSSRNIFYTPADSITPEQVQKLTRLMNGNTSYFCFDQALGWNIRANGYKEPYRANSAGIRANRDYGNKAGGDTLRIATFGDSFTHGDEVSLEHTWQYLLQKQSDSLQVLNFGVSGYGLDQALLRYQRQGAAYNPDVVLICFMVDDIYRHINCFRPFALATTGLPLGKPRFALQDEKLVQIPSPVRSLEDYRKIIDGPRTLFDQLGEHDGYYRALYKKNLWDFLAIYRLSAILFQKFHSKYFLHILDGEGNYNRESEAFKVTVALFDAFWQEVTRNGAQPLILLLPNRNDVQRHLKGGGRSYQPLLDAFDQRGYRWLDALEAIPPGSRPDDADSLFVNHYSPAGNRMVARFLRQRLKAALDN